MSNSRLESLKSRAHKNKKYLNKISSKKGKLSDKAYKNTMKVIPTS
jgi:hypothetical protein